MDENIKEIITFSGKFKATIREKPNCFNLDVYVLLKDFEPKTGRNMVNTGREEIRLQCLLIKGLILYILLFKN